MQHDFINPFSNPKTDRFDPDGTKCTDDNGIMDYFVVCIFFTLLLFIQYHFTKYFLNHRPLQNGLVVQCKISKICSMKWPVTMLGV